MDRFLAMDESEIRRRMRRLLPDHTEQAFARYAEEVHVHPRRGLMDLVSTLETDRTFRMPTLRLLDAHGKAGGQTWGFRFSHEIDAFGVPLGACHVTDVPLVFGLTDTPAGQLFTGGGPVAAALSAQVMDAWGRFARDGDAGWQRWPEQRLARTFGPGPELAPLVSAQTEQFWQPIL
jgi:para-nitrobenzyl esterase